MTVSYSRAPITEAVIELRFSAALSTPNLEKAKDKFVKKYPKVETQFDVAVALKANKSKTDTKLSGFRLIAEDVSRILILGSNHFASSKMAPYAGWEEFISIFKEDFGAFKRFVTGNPLKRIGIRYINRIDVPSNGESVDSDDYLTIGVKLPELLEKHPCNYLVHYNANWPEKKYGASIKSGFSPPALVGHSSIILDIDFYREVELPRSDDDIWSMLAEMRDEKDALFEACITDRTRELIR